MRNIKNLLKQKGKTLVSSTVKKDKMVVNSTVEKFCSAVSAGQGNDK